jgi:hypothetical protein
MICWLRDKAVAGRSLIRKVYSGVTQLLGSAEPWLHLDPRLQTEPRLRLDTKILAGVLIALLGMAAGLLSPAVRHHHPILGNGFSHAAPVFYQTVMVAEQVKRKVYPYSMVPGGAENVSQARRFMSDPAVKLNYANIDLEKLRQERLTTNLTGYVSYRWGEKIYWTAKKITLRAGETVFTDGAHIVRGRCLNCYSAIPMQPIRPHEPTEKALDTPAEMPVTVYSFPKLPVLAPELPIPPGELTPTVPIIPAALGPAGGKVPGGGFWFPLIPIIPPIHHHPGSPGSPGSGTTPVVPPVAVVPEPSYAWGLAAACLALVLAYRLRRIQDHRQ